MKGGRCVMPVTETEVRFSITEFGELVISLPAVGKELALAPREVGRLARWLTTYEPPADPFLTVVGNDSAARQRS
jgi:hypothetical protein